MLRSASRSLSGYQRSIWQISADPTACNGAIAKGDAMAELVIESGDLVLHLSRAERIEGLRGDLRVPLHAVVKVEVIEDAHQAADMVGFKAGIRIPGMLEVATVHGATKNIFAAVHRDTPRGVRVVLSGQAQQEWIVGSADPDALVASIIEGKKEKQKQA